MNGLKLIKFSQILLGIICILSSQFSLIGPFAFLIVLFGTPCWEFFWGFIWGIVLLALSSSVWIDSQFQNLEFDCDHKTCQISSSHLLKSFLYRDRIFIDEQSDASELSEYRKSFSLQCHHTQLPIGLNSISFFIKTNPLPQKNHIVDWTRYHLQSAVYTRDFFDAFVFGQPRYNESIAVFFQMMGLQHLLCFSGWHLHQFQTPVKKHIFLFHCVAIGYLYLLNGSFPFLLAYLKKILSTHCSDHTQAWCAAFCLALFFTPLAWLSCSFWLCFYFMILIEEFEIQSETFFWSSLGWSFIFSQKIFLSPWVFGRMIEPFMVYFFYLSPLLYGFHWLFPLSVNQIILLLYQIFQILDSLPLFSLSQNRTLGAILLLIPFLTISPKNHLTFTRTLQSIAQ